MISEDNINIDLDKSVLKVELCYYTKAEGSNRN